MPLQQVGETQEKMVDIQMFFKKLGYQYGQTPIVPENMVKKMKRFMTQCSVQVLKEKILAK